MNHFNFLLKHTTCMCCNDLVIATIVCEIKNLNALGTDSLWGRCSQKRVPTSHGSPIQTFQHYGIHSLFTHNCG